MASSKIAPTPEPAPAVIPPPAPTPTQPSAVAVPAEAPDYTTMSSDDLEARRVLLQRQKDAILADMHELVAEQERRLKQGQLQQLLRGMNPEEKARLLAAVGKG